jgi:hypothetical protein
LATRSPLPQHVLKCLEVFLGKLYEETIAASPAPPIAFYAADEPLAVMVDLDDRLMAVIPYPRRSFFRARGLLALVMTEAISPFYCPDYDVRCDAKNAKDNQDITNS